jgi:hypothetical protein
MQTSQLVLVGAVHWAHPAWHGRFYPDDLPEDWLLSYYNTQFQTVYLPASIWQAVPGTTWAQWLNDTQPEFCFVLEAGHQALPQPASGRVLLATPEWEREHVWWLDDVPDMRALAQHIIQQVGTDKPVFVFSRSGNLALLEQALTLKQVLGY